MVPAWQMVVLVVGGVVLGAACGADWQRRRDRKHTDQLMAIAADFARRRSVELGSEVAQRMAEKTSSTLIESVPGRKDLEEYLGYPLTKADPAWVLGAVTAMELFSEKLGKSTTRRDDT